MKNFHMIILFLCLLFGFLVCYFNFYYSFADNSLEIGPTKEFFQSLSPQDTKSQLKNNNDTNNPHISNIFKPNIAQSNAIAQSNQKENYFYEIPMNKVNQKIFNSKCPPFTNYFITNLTTSEKKYYLIPFSINYDINATITQIAINDKSKINIPNFELQLIAFNDSSGIKGFLSPSLVPEAIPKLDDKEILFFSDRSRTTCNYLSLFTKNESIITFDSENLAMKYFENEISRLNPPFIQFPSDQACKNPIYSITGFFDKSISNPSLNFYSDLKKLKEKDQIFLRIIALPFADILSGIIQTKIGTYPITIQSIFSSCHIQ